MTTVTAEAPPRPARRRRPPLALRGYFLLLLVLLYLPIAILFVFSFNDSSVVTFPLKGFTLEWYQKVIANQPLLRSIWASIQVAFGSSVIATVLGAMLAILLTRFEFRSKPLLAGLTALPLIVPYVVLGVALLILFRAVNVPLSLLTVGAAHAIVALPFTTLIIVARLVGFGNSLEEAAMDLGANEFTTFRKVTLPLIAPAILAGLLLSFALSIDDFVITNFVAGSSVTFPLFVWGAARVGAPPQVNVIGTTIFAVAVLAMLANVLIQMRRSKGAS